MLNHDQINDLRRRILRNEQVTDEEVRDALDSLAKLRGGAVDKAAAVSSPRKKKTQVDGQDLLDKFL